jgi:L-arabinokinase
VRFVYYISGHGLGHGSRSIEVMRAIRSIEANVAIVVRTAAPGWLFESAPAGVEYQAVETDTGVVQTDSLTIDEEGTARAAARFDRDFDRRAEDEARILRHLRADLVLADVPPLAMAAAHRAGVPAVAIANFTWDWIFSIYRTFDGLAPRAIPTMRAAYATTSLALRLPLHGGFETMPVVRDIPLVARRSSRDPADIRKQLGVDPGRVLVLSSFSGFGLDLPLADLARSNDFALLAPERNPPQGLRYEDLVAAADVVVSKPGYGIVSECAVNGTALLYTSRGHFIEYDVLVAGMPRLVRSRFIAPDDLRAGRWTASIHALLAQPAPAERPQAHGATVAAEHILEIAE